MGTEILNFRSDDYSSNDGSSTSKLKAIMLNKVVVGKGCKMTHDKTTLKAPPPGYDSVCIGFLSLIIPLPSVNFGLIGSCGERR